MSKKLISAIAAATIGASALSMPVLAEVTSTAGVMSDYVFRGASAGKSAAFGSADWSNDSGVTAGIWAVDNAGGSDGGEFDLYVAYGQEGDSFDWSVGLTRYEYTANTLNTTELNLGLAMGQFALNVDLNQTDTSSSTNVDASDGTHFALTYDHNDVYDFTVGQVDNNTEDDEATVMNFVTGGANGEDDGWTYIQATASGQVSDVDVSLTLGGVMEQDNANQDGYMTLTASKTFDGLGL